MGGGPGLSVLANSSPGRGLEPGVGRAPRRRGRNRPALRGGGDGAGKAALRALTLSPSLSGEERMKSKLYLEISIVSYLTARPSHDLIRAAHQQVTRDWWETRSAFDLYISQLVLDEAKAGHEE